LFFFKKINIKFYIYEGVVAAGSVPIAIDGGVVVHTYTA